MPVWRWFWPFGDDKIPAPRPPKLTFALIGHEIYVTDEFGNARVVALADEDWFGPWVIKQAVPPEAPKP